MSNNERPTFVDFEEAASRRALETRTTRAGSSVLVFLRTPELLIGAYRAAEAEWYPAAWSLDGLYLGGLNHSSLDLI